ncbi:MAG: TIGR04086 family membrane protein [Acutalibacteraceae bacterium]|nr:TIGR04086 family membrane protein [Acutalibacteraceae bacterium]
MYNENGKSKAFKALLAGTLTGLLLCSLLIFLLSFILVKMQKIPYDAIYILLQIIGAFSAFIGAYVTVRIYKTYGMMLGLITGFIIFFIVFVVGVATCVETPSVLTITKLVAMLCAGALGGIISVNKKKSIRKYKK